MRLCEPCGETKPLTAFEKCGKRGEYRRRICRACVERKPTRPYPGGCEVCGSDYWPCRDHDHGTGKFRGWLCRDCNLVLGIIRDDVQRLRALAEYLGA